MPSWGGPLDVAIAFTLIATSFLVWRRAGERVGPAELRARHAVAAVVPALVLAAMWWYRDALDFNVLLPGLAWRTWLVLYTLPSILTLVARTTRPAPRSPVA